MTLEQALAEFRQAMEDKFYLRAEKHGERGVCIAGDRYLADPELRGPLYRHLGEEIHELLDAPFDTPLEQDEAVDVANMAFLVWWHVRAPSERRCLDENRPRLAGSTT